ncbi:hypothetical protein ACT4Y5_06105 [Acinetobacter baumannii]|jgi:hypothetical protein|uniref:Uncharacterized protein n=1 Tax=Acinetobacter baumannii (strain SDF) TaxID=509170 RepID=B0VMH7_ACIBS|nr:hypothetical protein [Acinetobacter baumannii]MDV7595748.1 hypothetical protein [Acinetobacter baumannii]CAP02591.1 hypothetical protein ABSDF3322 [Acinetobacter baumannii SDF]HAV4219696.1 hypothetical protein [Acinetobacter baumannii]
MIISFRSRELRDNALNEFISLIEFPVHIVERLKFFLLVLSSSNNVLEIPLQHSFNYLDDGFEVLLDSTTSILFRQAHKSTPRTTSGLIIWEKVTRLQLIEVRNTYAK